MHNINNNFIFQDSASSISIGNIYSPNTEDQITIFITGTSISRTINFEGSDGEGNWFPALAVKLPDMTMASSTTGINEVWVLDTSNFVKYRINIVAISGGTVRITGKIVNMS